MSEPAFRSAPDEEWDALMRQLHDRPKGAPRPFFYSRVTARLTAVSEPKSPFWPEWILRPMHAALLAALVLSLSGDGRALHATAGASRGNAADNRPPLPR